MIVHETYRRSAARSALALVLFALCHSALAALPVKRRVRELAGERRADGLYRFGFCGVAVVTFGVLLRAIWGLPDRTIYRLRGLPRLAMLLGQLLCVAALLETNRQNGFGLVTGIGPAWRYLTGRPIERTPVAQHPPPEGPCLDGWSGPFCLSSHPNNYFALLLYWLSPVMTVKWAAIGAVTAAYMVLGSLHEDRRLRHAYGARYDCYRARVPQLFLLPLDVPAGRYLRSLSLRHGRLACCSATDDATLVDEQSA